MPTRKIFKPLGMKVTHFHTDLGRLVRNRAYAYEWQPRADVRLNTPQNERAGAGGLFTTVRELLVWDENFYTGRVGREGRDRPTRIAGPPATAATVNGYAWGLQVDDVSRRCRWSSTAARLAATGRRSSAFRDAHFSVAILCNVSNANPTDLSHRIADVYLGERFKDAVPAVRRSQAPAVSPAPAPVYTAEELATFSGVYASAELDTTYRFAVDNRRLTLTRGVEKQAVAMQPTGPDQFRAAPATLRFVRDAERRVTGLVLDAGRMRGIAFTRMPSRSEPASR